MPARDARRISLLLGAVTILPVAALCWLGVRMLAQDRALDRQRQRERLELAAERVALDLERHLQSREGALVNGAGVRLSPDGIAASASDTILYQPLAHGLSPVSSSALTAAAQLEFQHRDFEGAHAEYKRLSTASSPSDRGAALLAAGSLLRRLGRYDEALQAYRELEQLGAGVAIVGQPAPLVGLQGRGKVFEEREDAAALRANANEIAEGLYTGRWSIDEATFELYRDLVERWGGPSPDGESRPRTEAAVELWRAWRAGDLAARGRRLFIHEGHAVVVLWAGTNDDLAAAFITQAELQQLSSSIGNAEHVSVAVNNIDGSPVFGERSPPDAITLSPGQTQLPFLLSVSAADDVAGVAQSSRALILGGLLLALGFVLAGSYGLYRITTRELLLARQQSDFVAAVSHEFRTPLTSMRHLLDILTSRGIQSDERRAHYYGLLEHETERLHRMVESLLSFGRIDAGAHTWRLEPVDISELIATAVEDFGREAADRPLRVDIEASLPPATADREALLRALWNLLENAHKYSDAGTEIHVFARRQGPHVLLGVQDRGIGIAPADRHRIFEKFVRGDEATRAGIRGVGMGLALVKQIAEAHGGSVRLESERGAGSTFTLVIPCHGS